MEPHLDFRPPPLPDWLSADPSCALPKYPVTYEDRVLQEQVFTNLFETALDVVTEGKSIKRLIEEDPRDISLGRFLAWLKKDSARWSRYEEAQQIGAEVMVEEMQQIADDSLDNHELQVKVRRFKAEKHARSKYGENPSNTPNLFSGGVTIVISNVEPPKHLEHVIEHE